MTITTLAQQIETRGPKYAWIQCVTSEPAFRKANTTTDVLILLTIWDATDGDGTDAHPGEGVIAIKSGVSTRQVRRVLDKLRDLGYLNRTALGNKRLGLSDVYEISFPEAAYENVERVAEELAAFKEAKARGRAKRLPYTQMSGNDDSITGHVDDDHRTPGCPPSIPSFTKPSSKHSKSSRSTSSPTNDQPVDNPAPTKLKVPMRADWEPNKQNRNLAERLGLLQGIDDHAYAFRLGAHRSGGRREDWHEAFGGYLHAVNEHRSERDYSYVDLADVTAHRLHAFKADHPVADPQPTTATAVSAPAAPAVDQSPGRYTRGTSQLLTKISRVIGELNTDEKAIAAQMLIDGIPWNQVSSEIDDLRYRNRQAVA